jgi:hypothetical protein
MDEFRRAIAKEFGELSGLAAISRRRSRGDAYRYLPKSGLDVRRGRSPDRYAHSISPYRFQFRRRERCWASRRWGVTVVGEPFRIARLWRAGLVLCVDEKSQIQALNRTQAALPIWPGVLARMTHDYTRHGMTSLFAVSSWPVAWFMDAVCRAILMSRPLSS